MGSHPTSPIKVTDLLLNMIRRAAARSPDYLDDVAALHQKHVATAHALLCHRGEEGEAELRAFEARLEADIEGIKSILKAIAMGSPPVGHAYPHVACLCVARPCLAIRGFQHEFAPACNLGMGMTRAVWNCVQIAGEVMHSTLRSSHIKFAPCLNRSRILPCAGTWQLTNQCQQHADKGVRHGYLCRVQLGPRRKC
jgi:hypothetical protein